MDRVTRKELTGSLLLVLFGLGYVLHNLKYPLDTWGNPGPGVFPLIVGGVSVILSGYRSIQICLRAQETEGGRNQGRTLRSIIESFKTDERKPLLLIALFVFYLLMVKWVGFFTSDFLFVVFCSKLIGAKGWGRSVALSVGINLFCYFLFEVWLKLSFPRGFLF